MKWIVCFLSLMLFVGCAKIHPEPVDVTPPNSADSVEPQVDSDESSPSPVEPGPSTELKTETSDN